VQNFSNILKMDASISNTQRGKITSLSTSEGFLLNKNPLPKENKDRTENMKCLLFQDWRNYLK
jgi:hypothetical protein